MNGYKKCWRCNDLYPGYHDGCPRCRRDDVEEYTRQERHREERRRLHRALSRLASPYRIERPRDV